MSGSEQGGGQDSGSLVPRLSPGVSYIPLADAGVLYVEVRGELYRLDEVGAAICAEIDGSADLDGITDALGPRFAARRLEIRSDVEMFLHHLRERGLVALISA